MSTRSRRARDGNAADATAAQQPWPGKRARTEPRRRERDDIMLWPGKRARAAALRRPPVDPALDPLLDPLLEPSPVEDAPVELAEPDRDGHDAVEPAPPAAEADPDRE